MQWYTRILIWLFIVLTGYTLIYFNGNLYEKFMIDLVYIINKAMTVTREMYCQIPIDKINAIPQLIHPSPADTLHTPNLVFNGDFEQGFKGFKSEYQTRNDNQAIYFTYEPLGWSFVDKQKSNGLMWDSHDSLLQQKCLIVDGATNQELFFWSQQIKVQPHTEYIFSFKIQNIVNDSNSTSQRWQRAIIKTLFNDSVISYAECPTMNKGYITYSISWNSERLTSVDIKLIDINSVGVFNDFGIDDIQFHQLPLHTSFFKPSVYTPTIIGIQDMENIYTWIFNYRMKNYANKFQSKLILDEQYMSNQDHEVYKRHLIARSKKELLFNQTNSFIYSAIVTGIDGKHFAQSKISGYQSYIIDSLLFTFRLSIFLFLLVIFIYILLERNAYRDRKIIAYKYDMLGNIAHEIKTPVAAIMASVEGLNEYRYYDDKNKLKQYLGFIFTQSKRLSVLTEKILLQYSSASRTELTKTVFSVMPILDKIVKQFYYPTTKNWKIDIHKRNDLAQIHADETHFINIINTILDNSFKYAAADIQVSIQVIKENDWLCIIIRDAGMGIKPEDLKKVFKKFYRTYNSIHTVEGHGLGLYYVKNIMHLHRGKVELQSDGKTYTTITLKFKSYG